MNNGKSKSKVSILPKLAVSNIKNNASSYFPYIGVSIFVMFSYFSLDLILRNDIMNSIPRASYAKILLAIGFLLLNLILIPFLYYTNSYLIKRRKREIGLYNILGLEKKHIGILMLLESLIIYVIVSVMAILFGILFSKMIMLILMNLIKENVKVAFSISMGAITDLLIFYAAVMVINLLVNLWQVGKSNPVELLTGGVKGEKEPKHIGVTTVIGIIALGIGYYYAAVAKVNDMIFIDFFVAVFFVVIGTYCLFTAGSIVLLKRIKKRPGFYYKADNFISVSGMLTRMKKNAASLSNICVFSTMVLITAICTLTIMFAGSSMHKFTFPKTFEVKVSAGKEIDERAVKINEITDELAAKYEISLEDYVQKKAVTARVEKSGNRFDLIPDDSTYENIFDVHAMTLKDFNILQKSDLSLNQGEAIIYSSGADFDNNEVVFGKESFKVVTELKECAYSAKSKYNVFLCHFIVVFADEGELNRAVAVFGKNYDNATLEISCNPVGEEDKIDSFMLEAEEKLLALGSSVKVKDYRESIKDEASMNGALIFIGLFFGIIFMVCLVVIMYYKQISEGFEDRRNFEIMQRVGMSEDEIKTAINKQIRLVFGLPLLGAVIHTIIGMRMVVRLMAAISCFEVGLMCFLTVVVCLVFSVIYALCYKRTCAAYYRIVR